MCVEVVVISGLRWCQKQLRAGVRQHVPLFYSGNMWGQEAQSWPRKTSSLLTFEKSGVCVFGVPDTHYRLWGLWGCPVLCGMAVIGIEPPRVRGRMGVSVSVCICPGRELAFIFSSPHEDDAA